jgi:hypothetical protein
MRDVLRRVLAWSVLLVLVGGFIAFPFIVGGLLTGLAVWAIVAAVFAGCFAIAWALNEVTSR